MTNEHDRPFQIGDIVRITSGTYAGRLGMVTRIQPGSTEFYQVENAEPEGATFPPVYLQASEMEMSVDGVHGID